MPALSERRKYREARRRRLGSRATVTPLEAVAVVAVIAAVVAMVVWFFFFSGGGIGPGSV